MCHQSSAARTESGAAGLHKSRRSSRATEEVNGMKCIVCARGTQGLRLRSRKLKCDLTNSSQPHPLLVPSPIKHESQAEVMRDPTNVAGMIKVFISKTKQKSGRMMSSTLFFFFDTNASLPSTGSQYAYALSAYSRHPFTRRASIR
jgi:hypothetical protein